MNKGERIARSHERFEDYFASWLEAQTELRPKTKRLYDSKKSAIKQPVSIYRNYDRVIQNIIVSSWNT